MQGERYRDSSLQDEPVLNWTNFCFANLVRGIHRTATKLYSGSEKIRSTCSGNIRPVWRTLPLIG